MLAGCKRTKPPLAEPKPPEVVVETPVTLSVADYEDFTGRTESIPMVTVLARVSGELAKVYFKDGDDVKKGDDLFLIDPRQFDDELERAQATLEQTEASLTRKKKLYDRAKVLRKNGTNTPEDLENAEFDFKEADAARNVAIANKKTAELNKEYTLIKAAEGGRLSKKLIDVGNQVRANQTPLTTIVSLNPIYASFDVDERTVHRVRKLLLDGKMQSGRESEVIVQVGLADEEDRFSLTGKRDFSENQLDPGTGTLRVRIQIDNSTTDERIEGILASIKNLTGLPVDLEESMSMVRAATFPRTRKLSAGMFVRIRYPIGKPRESLLVPEQALVSDQGIRHLFVLDQDNVARYRPVTIGLQYGSLRVIERGLSKSDRVIVSGLQRVRPDKAVTPTDKKDNVSVATK
jgi:RND family efflux transporter MFP subunit